MSRKNLGNSHQETVQHNRYLRFQYERIYEAMSLFADSIVSVSGQEVEVGSTGGFLKQVRPAVMTTDVRPAYGLDMVVDAQDLPLENQSVSVIFAKDCLHHIPDITRFFGEASRVLKPGGAIVCVEPYWGPLARAIYTHVHPERFDTDAKSWSFESSHPMESNQALLYLMLRRDRDVFNERFPQFEILESGPLIGPSYILSGGVDHRSLLPHRVLIGLARLENRTSFWRSPFALGFLVGFRLKLDDV